MSNLRDKINKIISHETSMDKGLLVLRLLEDEGLGIDGNGWIDNDPEAQEQIWSDEVENELDEALL